MEIILKHFDRISTVTDVLESYGNSYSKRIRHRMIGNNHDKGFILFFNGMCTASQYYNYDDSGKTMIRNNFLDELS